MSNYLEENKRQNRNYWARLLTVSFILGAIAGTIGDYVHVWMHVDGYPARGSFPFLPFPERMPVWVPFLFGSAVMVMAAFHKIFSKLYHPRLEKHFVIASAAPLIFVVIYAMTGFFQTGTGSWEDLWLAAVTILLWFVMDGTQTGAIMAIVVAFFGTCFEIFLVSMGAFFYYKEHSNLMGVPSWLPWLYMCASICVSLFVRWV